MPRYPPKFPQCGIRSSNLMSGKCVDISERGNDGEVYVTSWCQNTLEGGCELTDDARLARADMRKRSGLSINMSNEMSTYEGIDGGSTTVVPQKSNVTNIDESVTAPRSEGNNVWINVGAAGVRDNGLDIFNPLRHKPGYRLPIQDGDDKALPGAGDGGDGDGSDGGGDDVHRKSSGGGGRKRPDEFMIEFNTPAQRPDPDEGRRIRLKADEAEYEDREKQRSEEREKQRQHDATERALDRKHELDKLTKEIELRQLEKQSFVVHTPGMQQHGVPGHVHVVNMPPPVESGMTDMATMKFAHEMHQQKDEQKHDNARRYKEWQRVSRDEASKTEKDDEEVGTPTKQGTHYVTSPVAAPPVDAGRAASSTEAQLKSEEQRRGDDGAQREIMKQQRKAQFEHEKEIVRMNHARERDLALLGQGVDQQGGGTVGAAIGATVGGAAGTLLSGPLGGAAAAAAGGTVGKAIGSTLGKGVGGVNAQLDARLAAVEQRAQANTDNVEAQLKSEEQRRGDDKAQREFMKEQQKVQFDHETEIARMNNPNLRPERHWGDLRGYIPGYDQSAAEEAHARERDLVLLRQGVDQQGGGTVGAAIGATVGGAAGTLLSGPLGGAAAAAAGGTVGKAIGSTLGKGVGGVNPQLDARLAAVEQRAKDNTDKVDRMSPIVDRNDREVQKLDPIVTSHIGDIAALQATAAQIPINTREIGLLQHDVGVHSGLLTGHDRDIGRISTELATLRADAKDDRSFLAQMTTTFNQKTSELKFLVENGLATVHEVDEAIANIRTEIAAMQATMNDHDHDDMQRAIRDILDKLRHIEEEAKKEATTESHRIGEIDARLTAISGDIKRIETTIGTDTATVDGIRQHAATLRAELDVLRRQYDAHDHPGILRLQERLKERLKVVEGMIVVDKEQLIQLKTEIAALDRHIVDINTKIARGVASPEDIAKVQQDAQALSAQLAQYDYPQARQEVVQMQGRIQELQRQMDAADGTAKGLQEKIADIAGLREGIAASTAGIAGMRDDVTGLRREVVANADRVSQLETRMDAKMDKLQQDFASDMRQLSELRGQYDTHTQFVTAMLNDLTKRVGDAEAEIKTGNIDVSKMREKLENIAIQIQATNATLQQHDNTDIQAQIATLEGAIGSVREMVDGAETRINTYISAELDKLTRSLDDLRSTRNTKHGEDTAHISTIQARLGAVEAMLNGDGDITTRIGTLRQQLQQLQEQSSATTTRISAFETDMMTGLDEIERKVGPFAEKLNTLGAEMRMLRETHAIGRNNEKQLVALETDLKNLMQQFTQAANRPEMDQSSRDSLAQLGRHYGDLRAELGILAGSLHAMHPSQPPSALQRMESPTPSSSHQGTRDGAPLGSESRASKGGGIKAYTLKAIAYNDRTTVMDTVGFDTSDEAEKWCMSSASVEQVRKLKSISSEQLPCRWLLNGNGQNTFLDSTRNFVVTNRVVGSHYIEERYDTKAEANKAKDKLERARPSIQLKILNMDDETEGILKRSAGKLRGFFGGNSTSRAAYSPTDIDASSPTTDSPIARSQADSPTTDSPTARSQADSSSAVPRRGRYLVNPVNQTSADIIEIRPPEVPEDNESRCPTGYVYCGANTNWIARASDESKMCIKKPDELDGAPKCGANIGEYDKISKWHREKCGRGAGYTGQKCTGQRGKSNYGELDETWYQRLTRDAVSTNIRTPEERINRLYDSYGGLTSPERRSNATASRRRRVEHSEARQDQPVKPRDEPIDDDEMQDVATTDDFMQSLNERGRVNPFTPSADADSVTCAICIRELKPNDDSTTVCGDVKHSMHTMCVRQFIDAGVSRKRNTIFCPTCRTEGPVIALAKRE